MGNDDKTGATIQIKDYWKAGTYNGTQIQKEEENVPNDGQGEENEVIALKSQELAIRESKMVVNDDLRNQQNNIPIIAKQGTNKLEISLLPSSFFSDNHDKVGARFVIGAGKPFGMPWFKLLGNDGAI